MAVTKLSAIAGAGAIVTTDTLVGVQSGTTDVQYTWTNAAAFFAAATSTLTNKTFDTAGTGNVFKIAGTTISAVTGTGSAVLATSPAITTPAVTGLQTITNGATLPSPIASSVLQIANTTSGQTTLEIDAFANQGNVIFRRAQTSSTAPGALTSALSIGQNSWQGYNGTTYVAGARIGATTTATTWDGTHNGTFLSFQTTADSSSTVTENLRLQGSGGLSVGNANIATDGGTGVIVATGVTTTTLNGNTFTTGTYTLTGVAGKTLTFNNSITLAGTDAQTYTFPTTTATIARTDAAQTFTGSQTFSSALIYGGVTLSNAVTGTGNMVLSAGPSFSGTASFANLSLGSSATLTIGASSSLVFTGGGRLTSQATGQIQHGSVDAAAPVAQTISFQSVVAGTSNTAGVNATFNGSTSTGSGTAGDIIFQTGGTGAGATAQNAFVTALTIKGATQAVLAISPTGGIGYGTGAGGTVTQATSKSTGVTLNKTTGQITMNAASLAGQTEVSFTLTNSAIAATDVVLVSIASGATANSYVVGVGATAAGSCVVQLGNVTLATNLSEAVVLNFAVIKGVTS